MDAAAFLLEVFEGMLLVCPVIIHCSGDGARYKSEISHIALQHHVRIGCQRHIGDLVFGIAQWSFIVQSQILRLVTYKGIETTDLNRGGFTCT